MEENLRIQRSAWIFVERIKERRDENAVNTFTDRLNEMNDK